MEGDRTKQGHVILNYRIATSTDHQLADTYQ